MAEYCESSRLPEVGEVPHQTEHHISFQDASLASLKLSVALRIIVWNILSYFFMYVSVSNLHFPQMKLASENPPEAILEGVIFKIFLGEHTSRPPKLWHALRHPSLVPGKIEKGSGNTAIHSFVPHGL